MIDNEDNFNIDEFLQNEQDEPVEVKAKRIRKKPNKKRIRDRHIFCEQCKKESNLEQWKYDFNSCPCTPYQNNINLNYDRIAPNKTTGVRPMLPNKVFRVCPFCGKPRVFPWRRNSQFPNVVKFEMQQIKQKETKALITSKLNKGENISPLLESDFKDYTGNLREFADAHMGRDSIVPNTFLPFFKILDEEFTNKDNSPFDKSVLMVIGNLMMKHIDLINYNDFGKSEIINNIEECLNKLNGKLKADTKSLAESIYQGLNSGNYLCTRVPSKEIIDLAREIRMTVKQWSSWSDMTKQKSKKQVVDVAKIVQSSGYLDRVVSGVLNRLIAKGALSNATAKVIFQDIQKDWLNELRLMANS